MKVNELLALKCTNCGGRLEVKITDVETHTQTAVLKHGMVLKCPHCHTEHAAGVELPRPKIVQNFGGINITAGNNVNINVKGNVITGDKVTRTSRRMARREQTKAKINHSCMMKVYDLITEHFNLDEFEELCFELDIDHENIEGHTLSTKARNIVLYAKRQQRMFDLLDACDGLRPEIKWPTWDELVVRPTADKPKPPTTSEPAKATPSTSDQPSQQERPAQTIGWFSKLKAWWQQFRSTA